MSLHYCKNLFDTRKVLFNNTFLCFFIKAVLHHIFHLKIKYRIMNPLNVDQALSMWIFKRWVQLFIKWHDEWFLTIFTYGSGVQKLFHFLRVFDQNGSYTISVQNLQWSKNIQSSWRDILLFPLRYSFLAFDPF